GFVDFGQKCGLEFGNPAINANNRNIAIIGVDGKTIFAAEGFVNAFGMVGAFLINILEAAGRDEIVVFDTDQISLAGIAQTSTLNHDVVEGCQIQASGDSPDHIACRAL